MLLSKKNIYTHNYTDDEIVDFLNNSKVSMYKKYNRNGHSFYLVDLILSENKIKSFEWLLKNNIDLNKIIKKTLNKDETFLDKYLNYLCDKYESVNDINNKIINILDLIEKYQHIEINYNFLIKIYNINNSEINENNEYVFYKIHKYIKMDAKNIMFLADRENKEFIIKILKIIDFNIHPSSFFKYINHSIYGYNLNNAQLKQRIFNLTLILDVKNLTFQDLYRKNKIIVINKSIENTNAYCFDKVIRLVDKKKYNQLLLKCIDYDFEHGIRYLIKELDRSHNLDYNIINKIKNGYLKNKIMFILKHKLKNNLKNHITQQQITKKKLNKL